MFLIEIERHHFPVPLLSPPVPFQVLFHVPPHSQVDSFFIVTYVQMSIYLFTRIYECNLLSLLLMFVCRWFQGWPFCTGQPVRGSSLGEANSLSPRSPWCLHFFVWPSKSALLQEEIFRSKPGLTPAVFAHGLWELTLLLSSLPSPLPRSNIKYSFNHGCDLKSHSSPYYPAVLKTAQNWSLYRDHREPSWYSYPPWSPSPGC